VDGCAALILISILASRMGTRRGKPTTAITRRQFVAGASSAIGVASSPALARAVTPRRRRPTIAVLGGGVGGLSTAHELAERGYRVTVFERRALGGKARSVQVPQTATGGRRPLPGEHGMRTFPGFYQNLPDTLRRIPFGSSPGGVFDNLSACSQLDFARAGGREDLILPLTLSPAWTPEQVRQSITSLVQTNLPPQEASYFADRLLVFFSSCDARRYGQWETTSWQDFTHSGNYSADYQRLLTGWINRQLLSARSSDVSALTVGILWEAGLYNLMGRTGNGSFDRVLSLPTNEAWIDPWVAHLRQLGVRFESAEVQGIATRGERVSHISIRTPDGRHRAVTADWFVLAVPVERAVPLVGGPLSRAAPALRRLASLTTACQAGIQFYLRRQLPIAHGHVLYIDSPWAVSAISQAQFWPHRSFSRDYGNGRVRDCLSVDIADWNTPGLLYGRPARLCTPRQIAREVWAQMRAALNDTGRAVLHDDQLESWFLDPGVSHSHGRSTSEDPLLISTPGSWRDRPHAATALPNLFLAADYVRTDINTACMEGANEAARRAVNQLLAAAGSREAPSTVYPLYRPPEFEPLRQQDAIRYARGQANVFDVPPPPGR
jgi:uncharacterized protein with NAD-binding domain and iron-sulfur cluster